jgi:hypothetical protein
MDNNGADARRLGLPSTATTHATTTANLRIIFDTHLTLTKQWVAKSLGLGETSQATASVWDLERVLYFRHGCLLAYLFLCPRFRLRRCLSVGCCRWWFCGRCVVVFVVSVLYS